MSMFGPLLTLLERSLNKLVVAARWWIVGAIATVLLVVIGAIALVITNQRDEQQVRETQRADTEWLERMLRIQLNRQEEALRGLVEDLPAEGRISTELKLRAQQLLMRSDTLEALALYGPDYEFVDLLAGKAVWLPAPDLPPAAQQNARYAHTLSMGIYGTPYLARRSLDDSSHARPEGFVDLFLPLPRYRLHDVTPEQARSQSQTLAAEDPRNTGFLIATLSLSSLLAETIPSSFAVGHEVALHLPGGMQLASLATGGRGYGQYVAQIPLELPGTTLSLKSDAVRSDHEVMPRTLLAAIVLLTVIVLISLGMLQRDIRQRSMLERRLRSEVVMRRAMEDSLITGLRARNMDGQVTYVNRAFCDMLGYSESELIGTVPPAPYWAPEMTPQQRERRVQRLEGRWSPDGFETVFVRKDGSRIHVLIYEAPLVDNAGRQTGWMSSILDITSQRRAEDLSRIQQERLEFTARLTAMGELASTIAHELNQPLAAITSYAAACRNLIDSQRDDPVMMREALSRISQQSQRSGEVLRSLLDFVRRREPQPRLVSVPQIVERIRPIIELLARKGHANLSVDVPDSLPDVHVDPPLVEQVLVNLTRNGLQAIAGRADGKRRLTITAAEICSLPGRQAMILISVADDGTGIAQDMADKLFAPFFTTRADGVGLGLNLSRTIIERHGGNLWIEQDQTQKDGHATMFCLTIPVAVAAAAG